MFGLVFFSQSPNNNPQQGVRNQQFADVLTNTVRQFFHVMNNCLVSLNLSRHNLQAHPVDLARQRVIIAPRLCYGSFVTQTQGNHKILLIGH